MQPYKINPFLLLAAGQKSMPPGLGNVDRPGILTSAPKLKPGVGEAGAYQASIPGVTYDATSGWRVLGMPWWLALGLGVTAYFAFKR